MKKTTILLSLLLGLFFQEAFGQTNQSELSCATVATPQQLKYLEQTARLRQSYRHVGNKATIFVPVQNHIIRRSDGTGGLSANELSDIMLTLNHYYSNVDIEFYECNGVNFIDDDAFYDFNSADENLIAGANDVMNVINIYYFNSVRSGRNAVCGYSRFPPSVDRVVMDNSCALNGSTIVHELGHYFSLFHTHGKTNFGSTDELVNGFNCAFAGDDVCDTPADPNLRDFTNSACQYTGTDLDDNGDAYQPDVDNIMSYSRKSCRRLITPGQYDRVAFSLQNDRNYLICSPSTLPSADFRASTSAACNGTIAFRDLSTSLPTSWVWDFGDGNTSSARNPTHRYKQDGTYTVTLQAINSNGMDMEVKTSYISINLPPAPNALPSDSACKNASATLSATGNGTLHWYNHPSSGNSMDSGNVFITPPIGISTAFYVESHVPNAPQKVGPPDNSFGSGGNFTGKQHLVFDALKPFILNSVKVYADGAKERTFELRNSLNLVLMDTTIFVGDGQQTVNLNFNIPVGEDLQLGLSVVSEVDLYRNSLGTSYPYDVPGILSIKRSSTGSGAYYFFYDWEIREADCVSDRIPVVANVKNCAVGMEEQILSDIRLFPNPSDGYFNVNNPTGSELNISIISLVGSKIMEVISSDAQIEINLTEQVPGIYFVKLQHENQISTRKVVIE